MYLLTHEEQRSIAQIQSYYYMVPTLQRIEQFVHRNGKDASAWREVFNNLHPILVDAKPDVDILLQERKSKGEINDISQARKSIAGAAFSNALAYVFIKNKLIKNIKPSIFITSQVKNPMFNSLTTINVGSETQKPDMDLIIYTLKENQLDHCIILSLKTSLRERAGQTYKWKLLMEIAMSENSIKEKYDIIYHPKTIPLVCFATVNFYNEINNPQHRGMFKFFDKSFIAKPMIADFISPMSDIIDFVNHNL